MHHGLTSTARNRGARWPYVFLQGGTLLNAEIIKYGYGGLTDSLDSNGELI
jgi:hypothetical protein